MGHVIGHFMGHFMGPFMGHFMGHRAKPWIFSCELKNPTVLLVLLKYKNTYKAD